MGFRKCPRCELNYISDSETLCKVCRREIRGEDREEDMELCSVCNERPVMPGKDICAVCFKEMEDSEEKELDPQEQSVDEENLDAMEDMDEIIDDDDDKDIPEGELEEIESDLSLDELGEEEDQDDEEEEEEFES